MSIKISHLNDNGWKRLIACQEDLFNAIINKNKKVNYFTKVVATGTTSTVMLAAQQYCLDNDGEIVIIFTSGYSSIMRDFKSLIIEKECKINNSKIHIVSNSINDIARIKDIKPNLCIFDSALQSPSSEFLSLMSTYLKDTIKLVFISFIPANKDVRRRPKWWEEAFGETVDVEKIKEKLINTSNSSHNEKIIFHL